MRYLIQVLVTLLLVSVLMGQKRIVVTSDENVVPLRKGQSALKIATEQTLHSTQTNCTGELEFGYNKSEYPCNNNFVGYHKDVWGQWFIAPAEGWIDSFYFSMADQNNMLDSTCLIAIWKSNIYPPMSRGQFDSSLNLDTHGRGPGWGQYNPPRHVWGYYLDSGNLDQGITPFKYRADDTQWIPTNMYDFEFGDTVPSFDPLGDELWGGGGYAFKPSSGVNNGVLNTIDLNVLPPKPYVLKGQPIFVTIEQLGEHVSSDNDYAATWCATRTGLPTPTRNWKFYNHPAGGGGAGWHARGEGSWVWSLVMTVQDNLPPEFISVTQLLNTTSTEPRTVTVEIQDCNPGHPDEAGIASVMLYYRINTGQWSNAPLLHQGGDVYEATLPGIPAGSFMSYYILATDVNGDSTVTYLSSYQIIKFEDEHYVLDTNATFDWTEINTIGTKVQGNDFVTRDFNTPGYDDGTAGPVNMNGDFIIHGDTIRYAWIGVDGGVAFTYFETDRQYVEGGLGGQWTFPSVSALVAPSISVNIPDHFVSVFYSDLYLYTPISQIEGNIYYHNAGSKFIVEWDSVGTRNGGNDFAVKFQLVFDNADNSITFNYLDVGIGGLENIALVGMQTDTLTKWNLLVNGGNPPEMKPRNGRAFTFNASSSGIVVADGWNLVSVPVSVQDNAMTKVFPNAISPAFTYQAGYQPTDTLVNGLGYWLKFNNNQTLYVKKLADISTDTIKVNPNWNMIGSISKVIPVSSIISEPPGIIATQFVEYQNGYSVADSIKPGKGYWVKMSQSGKIILSSTVLR
ncbi:MAG: hypothetical protein HYZ33_00560 [Ignavibacteriales bacterium]|nr:hypothetical protein [Ignavibacteriales bacterium]